MRRKQTLEMTLQPSLHRPPQRSRSTRTRRRAWIRALASLYLVVFSAGGCECGGSPSSPDAGQPEGASKSAPHHVPDGTENQPPDTASATQSPSIQYAPGPEPAPSTVLAESGDVEVTLADYRRFLRRSLLFRDSPPDRNRPAGGDGSIEDWLPARRLASPRLQVHTVRSLLKLELARREAERLGVTIDRGEVLDYLDEHDRLARYAPLFTDATSADVPLPGPVRRSDVLAVARRQLLHEKLRDALADSLSGDDLWKVYRRRENTVAIAYVRRPNSPTRGTIEAFMHRNRTSSSSQIERYFHEHRDEFAASQPTRPIRRQIAATLLRQSIVPSARQALDPVLEVMHSVDSRPDGTLSDEALSTLRERLDRRGYELKTTESFSRADEGTIPSLGPVRPLFDAAFGLGPDRPVAEELILARDHVYAFRLLDRHRPSRETFEAKKESFRRTFLEQHRDKLVQLFLRQRLREAGTEMNLEPLRIVHGRIDKSNDGDRVQHSGASKPGDRGGGSRQSTSE
ncbi:MAG: hypothetical protein ABEL76_00535 [Bradymonadaceae bacterium]